MISIAYINQIKFLFATVKLGIFVHFLIGCPKSIIIYVLGLETHTQKKEKIHSAITNIPFVHSPTHILYYTLIKITIV